MGRACVYTQQHTLKCKNVQYTHKHAQIQPHALTHRHAAIYTQSHILIITCSILNTFPIFTFTHKSTTYTQIHARIPNTHLSTSTHIHSHNIHIFTFTYVHSTFTLTHIQIHKHFLGAILKAIAEHCLLSPPILWELMVKRATLSKAPNESESGRTKTLLGLKTGLSPHGS